MVQNNYKLPKNQQLGDFEKQTVFKQANAIDVYEPNSAIFGIPQNLVASMTYLFGFFSGAIILLFEKKNHFIRFHAMQSIYLSTIFLTTYMVLGMLPLVGWISGVILSPIGLVLWIILMLDAFNGKYIKIIYISKLVEKHFS
ncbi:DUF4870 domain-containing protein [Planococcus sp. YIM B11945]|uniref:DUF4870 domain-containing protein n=1 Tax=Planococcus sp. YIM B11945 TaxID=3435410 RepID=UPI003D7CEB7F